MLLQQEELSVVELQEILGMGQSRISTHLSQLKKQQMVEARRSGKNVIYAFAEESEAFPDRFLSVLRLASSEVDEIDEDNAALRLILNKRKDRSRAYFDELAGKFGRAYVPGRSWKSLAETLIKLLPPMVIADLGAGEGTLSQLLAQKAEKVIAVDNSEKMVDYGAGLAKEHGFSNLEYRIGDIETVPIDSGTVDLAIFSQALHHATKPATAIEEAYRIVKPGGRIMVLDLLRHQFEDARELYADVWLGFTELELSRFLEDAGFTEIEITVVDRETNPPNFQTLMAIAVRPQAEK